MDTIEFLYSELLKDLPTFIFFVIIFFSPLVTIVANKKDYSKWKETLKSIKSHWRIIYQALALVGALGARFLIVFFTLISFFILVQVYDWSRLIASLFLTVVDLIIWGFLDKWGFLAKEPLAVRTIFIYLAEMFVILGVTVGFAHLVSLII